VRPRAQRRHREDSAHRLQALPRGKERATDYWLSDLLDQPNPWQTGFEFREMQQAHLELNGNFYAIKTVVRDETRELLPIPPTRMKVELLKDWSLKYTMTFDDGTQKQVPNELMYHQRGLTLNGFTGVSPVGYQKETMGFGVALRKYGNRMFKNGANVGGVLEHPNELSPEAAARLKESFEEKYSGLDNAHKIILLEEGTKFSATGMKADEAQFLQSRKFSRSEIAGMYRVPPHLIGDLERATFSNIEQQSLDYVQNGLFGRARRCEARMALALIPQAGSLDVLHRASPGWLAARRLPDADARLSDGILTGYITRNQVRELENMNPGPPELDEFLVPLNMATADKLERRRTMQKTSDPSKTEDEPYSQQEESPCDLRTVVRSIARRTGCRSRTARPTKPRSWCTTRSDSGA
jgi:HK97 family phage portal protein